MKAVVVGVPLIGLVLAVAAAWQGGFAAAQPWRWLIVPVCFAGVVLAERFPVKIGAEQKVNLGALPCLLAVLLLPAGAGPATAAVSVLAGNLPVPRSWLDSPFNPGNLLLAGSLAAMLGTIGTDMGAAQDALP